ncbi:MAG TPA: hypothetical protein VMT81_01015 [Candidatus Paceibacterota bacterium]|nr:hypothetical protein [Candidatus Paceibacterota bacterium]
MKTFLGQHGHGTILAGGIIALVLIFLVVVAWIIISMIGKAWNQNTSMAEADDETEEKTADKAQPHGSKLKKMIWAMVVIAIISTFTIKTLQLKRGDAILPQPGALCSGRDGDAIDFDYSAFAKRRLVIDVPSTTEGTGCFSMFDLPKAWGMRARFRRLGDDPDTYLYFMVPGGAIQGPFGKGDVVNLPAVPTLWIQATKKGTRIEFWSDALLRTPASTTTPPPEPATPARQ